MTPLWYAGHIDGSVTVIGGSTERPLPHLVKHSPTGFGWGYNGSGAAELARSLLIHALGDNARCQVCDGTGQVVYGPDGEEMSVGKAEARLEAGIWTESVVGCMACDGGVAVLPSMYQEFKFDVIARLAEGQPWTLPQAEVLSWHNRHQRQLTLGGE